MRNLSANGQYAAGFASAVLLLAGVALLSQAVTWFTANPQPQAFIEFLNTPMFSILDVFTAIFGLLVLAVLVTVPYWGPRP